MCISQSERTKGLLEKTSPLSTHDDFSNKDAYSFVSACHAAYHAESGECSDGERTLIPSTKERGL